MRRVPVQLLALLAAGCPSSPESGSDGRVRVHAFTEWGPAAGATVIVHHADGTPIVSGLTDDDGAAHVTVGGGEMVSVWYLVDIPDFGIEQVSMQTIAGVQPGDELFYSLAGLDPALPDRGEVEFTLGAGPFVGADRYAVRVGGCGVAQESTSDPAGTVPVTVPAACGGEVFVPWTAALATSFSVAFQVGDEQALDTLVSDGVTFEGPWRTDFDEVAFTLASLPEDAASWGVGQTLYDASGGRLTTGGTAGVPAVQGDVVASFPVIPFPTAAFAATVAHAAAGDAVVRRELTLDPDEDFTVDFAALPFVTAAHVAATAEELTVSWSGAPADAEQLQIDVQYFAGVARSVTWKVRLPGDTPSPFVFPRWPDELADNVHPDDAFYVDPCYLRFVYGDWPDADAARTDDPRDDLLQIDRTTTERRIRPAP